MKQARRLRIVNLGIPVSLASFGVSKIAAKGSRKK
jgi:hypothetical protein